MSLSITANARLKSWLKFRHDPALFYAIAPLNISLATIYRLSIRKFCTPICISIILFTHE